jgi:hypothetical protein
MSTEVNTAPLYVTFLGGLVAGFHAVAIDDKSETERLWYKNEARRVHSQYIELQDPADVLPNFEADRNGATVVFIGDMNGGDVFGPFSDEDVAEAFAADYLDQREMPENAFQLFTMKESHTKRR